jgi:hypothetical protein
MNDTVVLICIGFIIGALVSSGVWITLLVIGRARNQLDRAKNQLMQGIAEESAEADKVLSSSVAKAMNAHAMRSALLPRIEKMQKSLTANMHLLDVYFVKYMESRIASYRSVLDGGEVAPAELAVDKYLSEAKLKKTDTSTSIAEEIKSRVEMLGPAASAATVVAPKPEPARPIVAQQKSAPTTPVAPKVSSINIEPPALDLRTGIITVSQDAEEKSAKKPIPPKASPAAPLPKPVAKEIKDAKPAAIKPAPAAPAPKSPEAEEFFDLEKAMGPSSKNKTSESIPSPADTQALHAERIEKTMQWDRSQLMGAASSHSESVVVEGAEISRKAAASPVVKTTEVSDHDGDEPIISGEDIENTLDSFFGLNKE